MAKTYLATKTEVQTIATDVATIDQQLNTPTTGIEARITALQTGNGTVIVDNLTTSSATSALSASQGVAIKVITDGLKPLNLLTSTDTTKNLSAAQGKVLNDKFTPIDNLTSTDGAKTLSAAQGKILNDFIVDLQTLGTQLTATGTDTLTGFTAEDVASLTLTKGKWVVFGSIAMNQTANEGVSEYICGVITTNPTAYTTQDIFVSSAGSVLCRMAGGEDLAVSTPVRYYSSAGSTVVTLRLFSSFTTEASTVKSTLTAVKIGI
jgi:hypothetical protein